MKFFKGVEKHVRDLFKGKDVITNVVMLGALLVITCYIVHFFINRFSSHSEGFDFSSLTDDVKTEGKKILCLFHMKGCGHCEKMMPEWDKFSAENDTDVVTKKIEQGSNHPWLEKYKIQGYPTIKYISDNGTIDYDGKRDATAFKEFCKSQS